MTEESKAYKLYDPTTRKIMIIKEGDKQNQFLLQTKFKGGVEVRAINGLRLESVHAKIRRM